MKNILHICNNYVSSKVHERLIAELSRFEHVSQDVVVPVRKQNDVGLNSFASNSVRFTFFRYPGGLLKYFPLLKVLVVFILFLKNWQRIKRAEGDNYSFIIVAHTLWSDGVIAFLYSLFRGFEYRLVVRNTDMNWFLPKLPHYRWLLWLVVKRSSGLIFVTPAYKQKFAKRYPRILGAAKDVAVLPNGIDTFWLEGLNESTVCRAKAVLFVGRFDRNKNLRGLFHAVEVARRQVPELQFWLVGGAIEEFLELAKISECPDWVRCFGKVESRTQLKELYRTAAVLAVPSFHETFGLVYLEALSQGCPFVCTVNEGVDGFFEGDDFCVAVDPNSFRSIGNGIVELIRRYPNGVPKENCSVVAQFDWRKIAVTYYREFFS